MTSTIKYKLLEFLIGDMIKEEDLKTIPLDYIMHVIITTHLLNNESMTLKEATAMTKTVISNESQGMIIYPKDANIRAFRVQVLYDNLFSVLTYCLSPIGLGEFVVRCFFKF